MSNCGSGARRCLRRSGGPGDPPTLDELRIEEEIVDALEACTGLNLVTGVPGSGKSTLLAAGTRRLLEMGAGRIQSYEAPIEFVFDGVETGGASLMSSSEIPRHFEDFADGLRASLRRRPAAVIVGEARDRETVEAAVNAADFGIAVYSTTHTIGVANTIRRLLSEFPEDERDERGAALIDMLNLVVTQVLVPNPKGGRTAIREWLVFDTGLKVELVLAALGVGLGAEVAWGQGFRSDLFDIVDEAGRDLFDMLRGGDGGGNAAYAALGGMVGYFNAGVLVLAGALLIYHTAAGVMDTGRTGRLGFSSWEVVRIVASVALLVPLPGGPSGGQHIVLDLAGIGGDFAQSVWRPFSASLLGSSGVSAPKPSTEGREVMMVDFLVVEVCRELAGKRLAAGPVRTTSRGGQVWRYDVAQGASGYDIRSHCGEVRFAGLDREGPRGEVARAHLDGMVAAREVLVPVAKRIAEPYENGQRFGEPMDWSAVSTAVAEAVAAYSGVVDAAVEAAAVRQNAETQEELAAEQSEDGSWTTAGSLFFRAAERIGEFNWSVVSAPEVTPPMLALKDRDKKSFKALLQISEDISTAVGTPVSALGSRAPQTGSAGGGAGSMLSQIFYTAMFSFKDVLDVEGDNPISELAAG